MQATLEQFEHRVPLAADFGLSPFAMDWADEVIDGLRFYEASTTDYGPIEGDRIHEFDFVAEDGSFEDVVFGDEPGFPVTQEASLVGQADLLWDSEYEWAEDSSGVQLEEARAAETFGLNSFESDLWWATESEVSWFEDDFAFGFEDEYAFSFATQDTMLDAGGSDSEPYRSEIAILEADPQFVEFVGSAGEPAGQPDGLIQEWVLLGNESEAGFATFIAEPSDAIEIDVVETSLPFFEDTPEFELATVSNDGLIVFGELDASPLDDGDFTEGSVFDLSVSEFPLGPADPFLSELTPDDFAGVPSEALLDAVEGLGDFVSPIESPIESLLGPEQVGAGQAGELLIVFDLLHGTPVDVASTKSSALASPLVQLPSGELVRLESAASRRNLEGQPGSDEALKLPARADAGRGDSSIGASDQMTDELRELAKGLTYRLLHPGGVEALPLNPESGYGHDEGDEGRDRSLNTDDPGTSLAHREVVRPGFAAADGVVTLVGQPIGRMHGIETFDVFAAVATTAGGAAEEDTNVDSNLDLVAVYESAVLMIGLPVAGISYAARIWRHRDRSHGQSHCPADGGDEPTVLAVVKSGNC